MTSPRILHIDDEPIMREIVAMSFELDPQFTVLACASGQEGVVVAERWRPDLILLDVVMPSMDGPATLRILRENSRTADIPVLFMTSQAQKCDIERLRSLGAVDVIAKPFEPSKLADLVRGYIAPRRDRKDGESVSN